MARSERRDDGKRGGTGTLPRTDSRPRRPAVPSARMPESAVPDAGELDQRRGRRARPQVPTQRAEARQQAVRPAGQQPGQRERRPAGSERRPGSGQAAPGAAPVPNAGARGRRPAANARPMPNAGPSSGKAMPNAQAAPQDRAVPRAAAIQVPVTAAGTHRMPFVLLLFGLLGGALVSALVISTTLAEGSFEITRLQQSTSDLARTRQALEEQVAQEQSAPVIQERAAKLGMRPANVLRFIDLTTGKTSSDLASGWESQISAPGYTP